MTFWGRQVTAWNCWKGDLAGRWSIRINDQFRIVFRWDKGSPNPSEVEIRDYH
jgi:proteic killer suppression protein